MTGLSLVVALQLSAVTAAPQPAARPYLEAYQRSVQSGRPFVVLLEADWCTAWPQRMGRKIAAFCERGHTHR